MCHCVQTKPLIGCQCMSLCTDEVVDWLSMYVTVQMKSLIGCQCVSLYRPIHDAVEADSITTVRLLLSAGADVTMKKYSGESVLHLAKSAEMKHFIKGLVTH